MDLPKGFVEDDKRIYGQVANLEHLPIDVIRSFWQVYTTTNRKLYDPTARRLENFWWHVWGSDRRHLKAEVLAGIWQHISYGPTFVPLKGSPNRYEPPTDSRGIRQPEPGPETGRLLPPILEREGAQATSQPTQSQIKVLSSSSSRPVPLHPILKKSRGDSKSGPRPTARFVSPPESGAEDDTKGDEDGNDGEEQEQDENASVSGASVSVASDETGADVATAASSSSVSPAKRSRKKKQGTPTKKFVASNASKRRPHLPRRHSSQSSATSSELASKAGSSAGSRSSGSQVGSLVSNTDRPSAQTTPDSRLDATPPPSAKALGKRPAVAPVVTEKSPQPRPPRSPSRRDEENVHTGAGESFARDQQHSTMGLDGKRMTGESQGFQQQKRGGGGGGGGLGGSMGHTPSLAPTSAPRAMVSSSSYAGPTIVEPAAPKMERASSSTDYSQRHITSIGRAASFGLLSNATATTSNVAARGQLARMTDEPDIHALEAMGIMDGDDDRRMSRFDPLNNSSAATLFKPTIPSPTPSVPLARSRSQLMLLLEREKERAGPRPPNRF